MSEPAGTNAPIRLSMNLSWERWRLAGAFLVFPPRLAGEDAGAPRFMVPMHAQSERRLSMNLTAGQRCCADLILGLRCRAASLVEAAH